MSPRKRQVTSPSPEPETTWAEDLAEIGRLMRNLDQKFFRLEKALQRSLRGVDVVVPDPDKK